MKTFQLKIQTRLKKYFEENLYKTTSTNATKNCTKASSYIFVIQRPFAKAIYNWLLNIDYTINGKEHFFEVMQKMCLFVHFKHDYVHVYLHISKIDFKILKFYKICFLQNFNNT